MSVFKGRYWCGNYCPRGSFYDQILAKFSPKKRIPTVFRSKILRVGMVILIMTVFSYQMVHAWGNLDAMGTVFIRLIFVTTLIGIALGVLFHHRSWCAFCPMGTMSSWVAAKTNVLKIASSCVGCKLCTKACPFNLTPYTAKGLASGFTHPDCLKCGQCISVCPKKAITYKS
jgi:polyferredoxin